MEAGGNVAEHPITPPPELVEQWRAEGFYQDYCSTFEHAIAQAARWGADHELEACCLELVDGIGRSHAEFPSCLAEDLRIARRPKPPSLKEQALEQLGCIQTDLTKFGMGISTDTIRRALEALSDD